MPAQEVRVALKELINISDFQNLLESFSRLTGIATAILDLKGDVLAFSGSQKICVEFHRKNPSTASRCLESDTILASRLARGEKYNIYKCSNGLFDSHSVCPECMKKNIREFKSADNDLLTL